MKESPLPSVGIETMNWIRPARVGGIETGIRRYASHLQQLGVPVQIFTGKNEWEFQDTVAVSKRDGPLAINYHPDMAEILDDLDFAISEKKVNVVQISDQWGLRRDYELFDRVLRLPVPIVWTTQNQHMLSRDFSHKGTHPELFSRFASRVNAFVCVSHSIAGEAKQMGIPIEKIYTIHNPVDPKVFYPASLEEKANERERLGIPKDKKIILFVGRITQTKKADFLLQSWSEIVKRDPSLHLVMVGNPQEDDKIMQSMYQEFKYRYTTDGSATFSDGFVADEEILRRYFQSADALIVPSKAEGLGNVVIEAMACGIPSIGSQIAWTTSGIGDLIIPDFNGSLFDSYTPEAVLAAISQIRPEFSQNAITQYQILGCTPENIADQYRRVYEAVLNEN